MPLGKIVPRDVPKPLSWIRVNNRYPSVESIQSRYLNDYGIEIVETQKHLLTPYEGNHRVARLTDLLGPLAVVTLTLKDVNPRLQVEQDAWIDIVRAMGINNFTVFLDFCKKGVFLPID